MRSQSITKKAVVNVNVNGYGNGTGNGNSNRKFFKQFVIRKPLSVKMKRGFALLRIDSVTPASGEVSR